MEESTTTWFYLLSTIAQTCGAILALSAAFVIYKIGEITQGIQNYRGRINSILELSKELEKGPQDYFEYSSKKILEEYRNKENIIYNDTNFTDAFITKISERYPLEISSDHTDDNREQIRNWGDLMANLIKKNLDAKNRTFFYLWWSLALLTTAILFSLTLLFLGKIHPNLIINDYYLFLNLEIALIAILYSAFSDWKIANENPTL